MKLTVNMNHDSLGYRRRNSILSNAKIGSSISPGELGEHQVVAFYPILD